MLEQDTATQTCSRCQVEKAVGQFERAYKGRIRRFRECRQCNSERSTLAKQEKHDRERREAEADLKRILNWPAPGSVFR